MVRFARQPWRNRAPFLQYSAFRTVLAGVVALLPTLYLLYKEDYGILITMMALLGFLLLDLRSKEAAVLGLFAFLILLGDIRRIATQFTGARGLDPLLLVGTAFSIYLAIPLLLKMRLKDPLSKAVLALMVVMILQIFNPRQGPLIVGISGSLFTLFPLLWFWIGRRYGSDRMLFLLFFRVVLPLGVLCALLGIYQTFIGFFPWEEAWAKSMGSAYRLTYHGNLRPFGFSNSGVEYGSLLLISAVLIIGAFMSKRRAYVLVFPVVGAAMVLSAMRGPIVRVIFAAAIMWAVQGKNVRAWVPRLVFGLLLGVGLMTFSATRAAAGDEQPTGRRSTANIASARVANGLAHPFEQKYSTGGMHADIAFAAVKSGFTTPVGSGLGATTLGAGKFGGEQGVSGSSEIDISDAFYTLGFLGGILYLSIIYFVMRATPQFLRSGPRSSRLTTVGVLAALLGAWIALGQYATAPFAWFCIGAMVRDIQGETEMALAHEDAIKA